MGKPIPEKKERNDKIFELKEQGFTFKALGAQYKLTEARIIAIYYRELKRRGMLPKSKREKK